MKPNIIFLVALISFLHLKTLKFDYYKKRPTKLNLSTKIKKSFDDKENFYAYRSFITGRKRGVDKELRVAFKRLNLLHLLTPSGLHYSSLFFFFILLYKRVRKSWVKLIEIFLCLGIYFFLDGYYSFRRVALLRAVFILFDLMNLNFFKRRHLFLLFFIFELFWGTFIQSPQSFIYSCAFLSLFFLLKDIRGITRIPIYLFCMQLIIGFTTDQPVSIFSLFLSPLITLGFTQLFPALVFNLPIITFFNYSETLIKLFTWFIILINKVSALIPSISVSWPLIIALLVFSKKKAYLSIGLVFIHFCL